MLTFHACEAVDLQCTLYVFVVKEERKLADKFKFIFCSHLFIRSLD